MKLIRTESVAILAMLATLRATSEAGVEVQQQGSTLQLIQDGEKVSSRPVEWRITEWQRRAGQQAAATQEVNTVGSIIEGETLAEQVLVPAFSPADSVKTARVSPISSGLEQSIGFTNGVQLTAHWQASGSGLVVTGTVWDSATLEPREVPITLSLVLPLDDENLAWFPDLHTSLPAGSEERIVSVATTAGARGAMSRYPFAAVGSGPRGLAVGLPLYQPRIHRLRWDGRLKALIAEVDVTLSPEPRDHQRSAYFEFRLFPFASEFGFRGATRAYYDLFPESFRVRARKHGLWMPFTPVDSVQRPEDFHFAYHEYHPDVSVAYNGPNNIESLVYCEPPVQYVHLAPNQPRTLESLNELVEGMTSRQGSQIRGSITHRADGTPQVAWVETPWAVGGRVPTNGDPDIPRTERNPFNSFDANWLAYQDLYRRNASGKPVKWSGGTIVDGVVGSQDRALYIRDGESTEQSVTIVEQPSFQVRVMASGAVGSTLRVTLGDKTAEASVAGDMKNRVIVVESPGGETARIRLEAVGGDVWIDRILAQGIRFEDESFRSSEFDEQAVTGLYLDSFEGWDSKDLNFRREHFAYSEIPLTFDAMTGQTGQVIMMHNFELAAEASKRLHERGHILMANTALYQWCWSAHYLDVLGIETSWGEGPTISPPRTEEMDYVRTMLYQKPYAYLQNLRYDKFRGAKVDQYMARCLHYGFWPGFFSHNAAEAPYWQDPSLYNADRQYFLRYMKVQEHLAEAGWEPITLATVPDTALMVERWGGKPYRGKDLNAADCNITVYNPTDRTRVAALSLDKRLADPAAPMLALDLLEGRLLALHSDETGHHLEMEVTPLGVGAVRFIRRDAATLTAALKEQAASLLELVDKYRRHGMVDDATVRSAKASLTPSSLATLVSTVEGQLEPVYTHEFHRAVSTYRILAAALEEETTGKRFAPVLPAGIVPGEPLVISAGPGYESAALVATLHGEGLNMDLNFKEGRVALKADERFSLGASVDIRLASNDASHWSPYYETRLMVQEAASFMQLPTRLVFSREVPLTIALRNNLSETQSGELRFRGPSSLQAIEPIRLTIPTGGTITEARPLTVTLQEMERDVREPLVLEWWRDGAKTATAVGRVPLVLLPRNASVLRDSDVTAAADSFYFGYDVHPLTDGILDTSALDWKDAAWASDEGMVPHWVDFTFETPRSIKEVKVHWAFDSGKYWASSDLTLEGMPVDGEKWIPLASLGDAASTDSEATFSIPAQSLRRIRLYQPPGKGPADRPGIMWLREVEAR